MGIMIIFLVMGPAGFISSAVLLGFRVWGCGNARAWGLGCEALASLEYPNLPLSKLKVPILEGQIPVLKVRCLNPKP